MPTTEEIKSICTEYVDELFAYDDMQDQENIEAKNDAFVMCMAFAGHILEKHCIVPKKSVAEWVNDIEFFMPDKRSVTMLRIGAKSLFGKELFNEEKEVDNA